LMSPCLRRNYNEKSEFIDEEKRGPGFPLLKGRILAKGRRIGRIKDFTGGGECTQEGELTPYTEDE